MERLTVFKINDDDDDDDDDACTFEFVLHFVGCIRMSG